MNITRISLIAIAICPLFAIACSGEITSNDNLKATIDIQNTRIADLASTPTKPFTNDLPTPLPTSIESGSVATLEGGLEGVNNNVSLQLVRLYEGTSVDGWKSYVASFAVRNESTTSVYFAENDKIAIAGYRNFYEPNLKTVRLFTHNSIVETSESVPYPAVATFGQGITIIPSGFTVLGNGPTDRKSSQPILTVAFRVPDQLNPTNLRIEPGISDWNSEPLPIFVDLDSELTEFNVVSNTTELSSLPTIFQTNNGIDVTIEFNSIEEVNYQAGEFVVNTTFMVENTDITGDRDVQLDAFLIDTLGQIYRSSCEVPFESIGPGQTKVISSCFKLPTSAAIAPRDFYLIIFGDSLEGIFTFEDIDVLNCQETNEESEGSLDGYPRDNVKELAITIPGTITDTINSDGAHHIFFEGKAGQTIGFNLQPDEVAWVYDLIDPAGKIVVGSSSWYHFNEVLSEVTPVCDGQYSLKIVSVGHEEPYTLSTTIENID